jgi:plastocyanin domain-containing protein
MRSAILALCTLLAAPTFASEKSGHDDAAGHQTAEHKSGDQKSTATAQPAAAGQLEVKVTDMGFEPQEIRVKKGEPVTIAFTRTTKDTCIKAVDFPEQGVKNFKLPLNKTVSLKLTPKASGTFPFHCTAMQMGDGKLIVE